MNLGKSLKDPVLKRPFTEEGLRIFIEAAEELKRRPPSERMEIRRCNRATKRFGLVMRLAKRRNRMDKLG